MTTRTLRLLALLAAPALLDGCHRASNGPRKASAAAASFDASVATRWMQALYDIVKTNPGLSPPVASRAYGYAGVTLYESVAPGMPGYQSLAGQLNGFAGVPETNAIVDYRAVANAALARVIRGGAVPSISAGNITIADNLETAVNDELAALGIDANVLQNSADHGIAVADAILAWLADDGFAVFANCDYTPPVGTGLWTALPGQTALQPCWDQIRPFVLLPGGACAPAAHPDYDETDGSPFFEEAEEVYDTTGDAGANLTADQTDIAFFWADGPGGTGTPPGHWVSITAQICDGDTDGDGTSDGPGETLAVAAEAYAKLGIAVADAFISCWQTKYQYNLERPITFLQRVVDATWDPLLSTPPFPEYTSGHSVQSGAAFTILTDVLGARAFNDGTHTIHNNTIGPGATIPPNRSFTDFETAALEAADSRLFGGIHFRAAIDNGISQGVCVGNEVLTLNFLE
jgi:hypothetical protein